MTEAVTWIFMLKVKDGKLDDVKALMDDMVEATRNEPGAQAYEWYVSADGTNVHIYERYADGDAALAHMGSFGQNFAERFFALLEPAGFNVYGQPSDAARDGLAGAGAQILTPLGSGGFSR